MRQVAFETVLRACGFGSLAIFCIMIGLSFEPRVAFQAGGFLTTAMSLILIFMAREALTKQGLPVDEAKLTASRLALEAQIEAFVADYNHRRYHESVGNLTPADVYFGRGQTILLQRERIKRQTIAQRRLQHQRQTA